ncbi:MAG TPA: substrate-binding domain-containing protein [Puia sp.]|jgi:LacI family transcriptional regulator|nr:substrate-binding domain-containing protein [Puia sp.]
MKGSKKNKTEQNGVKEIARRANVSIATVDRVLHNRTGVSAATQKKIHAIIKELNYQPNILARRLASRDVFNFAVLIPKVSAETDFWQAPLNGIKRAEASISEYGIKIDLYFFDINDRKSFEVQSKLILKNAPDGILLAPSFINEAIEFTTACRERNLPYVLIDSNIPNQEGLCYIGPHLFRSGYLSAQLMNFTLGNKGEILVINISKEVDDHNYLMQIEDGFRAYFKYHNLYHTILKLDITQIDYLSVEKELSAFFDKHPGIKAIYVTNSRVSTVARYLENAGKKHTLLIGFDFLEDNIEYLKKDVIDILICHKPAEQGYKGIMKLYQHFVLGTSFPKISFMPIDIVTKENYEFYDNYLND